MDPIAHLLDLIRHHRRATVERANLLDYYDICFPEWRNAPDREARCRQALDQLAYPPHAAITLPSDATAKARSKNYHGLLPVYVRKAEPEAVCCAACPPDNWLPELAELAATLRGGKLESLRQINEFLKGHPGPLPLVPYRERSLQIFGNEKTIGERLPVKGASLFNGRLPLARLGAYDPPLPFPFTMPNPPRPNSPLLVVENHHTFASLVAANDRQRAFSAIAWGGGNAFTKGCAEYIDAILDRAKATEVMYLGDLDPKGIQIPATVGQARQKAALPPVTPAWKIYSWLLDHGTTRPLATDVSETARNATLAWLGDEMGERVIALWGQGHCIPQESLGTEALGAGDMLCGNVGQFIPGIRIADV